jgi:hypothetical protein
MKTTRLVVAAAAAFCFCGLVGCQSSSKTSANMDVSAGSTCKDGAKACSSEAKTSGCCANKAAAKSGTTN